VIAILKKGDASLSANYRPISLINFVGKQRLHKQLMMLPCLSLFAFFDANNFQTI
jgi:hypothetical protein